MPPAIDWLQLRVPFLFSATAIASASQLDNARGLMGGKRAARLCMGQRTEVLRRRIELVGLGALLRFQPKLRSAERLEFAGGTASEATQIGWCNQRDVERHLVGLQRLKPLPETIDLIARISKPTRTA